MILLDTCTLLWLVGDRGKLSALARESLSRHRGLLFVSAISAFEIGTKYRKGKLGLPIRPEEWYERALEFHGLAEIPVRGQTAVLSTLLPPFHADPCDRLIIATAQLEGLTILTPDPLIHEYPDAHVAW